MPFPVMPACCALEDQRSCQRSLLQQLRLRTSRRWSQTFTRRVSASRSRSYQAVKSLPIPKGMVVTSKHSFVRKKRFEQVNDRNPLLRVLGTTGVWKVPCSEEKVELDTTSEIPPFQSAEEVPTTRARLPGAHSPGDLLLNKYKVVGVLGQGGNAVTYKAMDKTNNSAVAIKCLSLRGMKDWKQLDLFERESRTLEQLKHPGIPKYIECFEQDFVDDKCFYIVQEIAAGKTLAQLAQEGWRPSEDEIGRIAIELLSILEYLSSSRPPVVHRDVKPENIVLEGGKNGGRVYLVDFGGVQAVTQETFAMGSTIVGTYGYMAPEQFRGEARPSSDLYALGATLLFLLSGRSPNSFPQDRLKIDFQGLASMSEDFEDLLDGLLEPLPEDRISRGEAASILKGERQQELKSGRSGKRNRQPAGSKVVLKKGRSKLVVEIPPGMKGDSLVMAPFAVAWNSFVLFWTYSALTAAGAELAKTSIVPSLVRESLEIGKKKFTIRKELAFFKKGVPVFDEDKPPPDEATGQSKDLIRAELREVMVVNGKPIKAIQICEGVNKYSFGEGLDDIEMEWLVQEINETISQVGGPS